MQSVIKKLFSKPDLVLSKNHALYSITVLICTAALLVSIVLFGLSILLKSTDLALLSLIPFIGTLIVQYCNRNGKHTIAISLMYVLTLIFSVISTMTFGWGAGFQYFLIAQLVTFILYPHLKLKKLISLGIFVSLSFIALHWITKDIIGIDSNLTSIIHTFNAAVCLFVIGSSDLYFRLNLEQRMSEYSVMASTDFLTGLRSRRRIDADITKRINNITKENIEAMIFFDIDMFKIINDRLGNAAGDGILKQFAEFIESQVSKTDLVARWGGDEFIVLTQSTHQEHASKLAEDIRVAVKQHIFYLGDEEVKLSVTCAVTQLSEERTTEEILFIADQLIRIGKGKDGNNVITQDSIALRAA